jgi:hypothetical protein
LNLFDFQPAHTNPETRQLILDPISGEPVKQGW